MLLTRPPGCENGRGVSSPGRARIGIYEPGPGLSGQSRYMDSILSRIDRDEFEVVIFGHPTGPYAARRDVSLIGLSAAPAAEAAAADDVPMNGGSGKQFRTLWRRFAPGAVKLWGGFGRECHRLAAS